MVETIFPKVVGKFSQFNYEFADKKLLIRALTRKAFAQEQKQQGRNCEDQEVYRILGDAVLKAILVELLIQRGYDSRESITNKKIELEKRENLGRMFEGMAIAPFIRFSIGEERQGISSQPSVLGETFEAVVAAVHLDSGSYERTKRFVVNLFSKQVVGSSKNQTFDQDITSICDNCFQPDVCTTMKICHFDLTGDD